MTTVLGYPMSDLRDRGADHTAREIAQQPEVWRETGRLVGDDQATQTFLRSLLARDDLRVMLTGAGTSAFIGQVLAPGLARRRRRRVQAVPTTDIVSNPLECFAEDVPTLLVSFARSGDSPESTAATELARQCLTDCAHLVVTCNPDGRLARDHAGAVNSRVLLMPPTADDRGFAMTSSFTSMTLGAMLVLTGAPPDPLVERLAAAAAEILAIRVDDARALAARDYRRIVFLGSGALKGLARESALKVLELTAGRVVASSESALGFRHGPKAVLDERTLVVAYLSNDPYTRRYDLDIVAELRRSLPPGSVIAVTGQDADLPPADGNWLLPGLDDVDDAALALPAVICAQLIGLQLSLARGCTPDNPFPSGEVNRVVRGVTVRPLRS